MPTSPPLDDNDKIELQVSIAHTCLQTSCRDPNYNNQAAEQIQTAADPPTPCEATAILMAVVTPKDVASRIHPVS